MKKAEEYILTKGVTVNDLKDWINIKDDISKEKIIDLIFHRFYNRYIKHIKPTDSGFLKMAASCLMIETFQSFKLGIPDTTGKSGKMFESFFETEKEYFPGFNLISKDFYENIRCGILHQAETTNAWRILRKGDILDINEKAINADLFLESLEISLKKYISLLKMQDLTDVLWKNAIIKLEDICNNCNTVDAN